MDIIFDELRKNGVEINKETLSYHIDICLGQHKDIYDVLVERADRTSLSDIYQEMQLINFGRIMAYLALVFTESVSCDEYTVRKAVRNTVEHFKTIDLTNYERKPASLNWLTRLIYNAVERC